MAKLTDLSNELILAIRSYLEKPADILALTLANRRFYSLVLPLLYEEIHLDLADNTPTSQDANKPDLKAEHLALVLLARTLTDPQLPCPGPSIASLSVKIRGNFCEVYAGLLALLPHLARLLHLCLFVAYDCRSFSVFPAWRVMASLSSAKKTLTSLAISVEKDHGDAGCIGELTDFIALRHVCIQAHVLLGGPRHQTFFLGPGRFNDEYSRVSELLPASLETLQIHCCMDGREFGQTELVELARKGLVVSCPLEAIGGEHQAIRQRVLKSVVVGGRVKTAYTEVVIEDLKLLLDVVGASVDSLAVDWASKKKDLRHKDPWAAICIV